MDTKLLIGISDTVIKDINHQYSLADSDGMRPTTADAYEKLINSYREQMHICKFSPSLYRNAPINHQYLSAVMLAALYASYAELLLKSPLNVEN